MRAEHGERAGCRGQRGERKWLASRSGGVATLSALLAWCVLAAPVRAEVVPLSALEALALQRRPALDAGGARVRGSEAEVDKATSAYYPRLSLEASGMLGPGGTLATVKDTKGREFLVSSPRLADDLSNPLGGSALVPQVRSELGLELKGNLYDFGRTAAGVSASRAAASAVSAGLASVRHSIVRGVRGAYLNWLASSELLALAEHAQRDAKARRVRAEERVAEGVRPRSDVPAARAEELLSELELERARGELRGARLLLEQAVGSPLAQAAEPDRSLLEAATAGAAASPPRSPAGEALELQATAAAMGARAAGKASLPVLSGAFSAGVRTQDEHVFPAYSLGLHFSLPLWDGGGQSANARVADAQAAEASARVREQREQDRAAAERARLDAENASARMLIADQLLEIAMQRSRDAEQSYELGATDLDALAGARALLRRAQTEAVLARIARAQARLL